MGFKFVKTLLAPGIGHEAVGAVATPAFAAVAASEVVFGGEHHPVVRVKVVFVGREAGDVFVGGTSGRHAKWFAA